jgi:hypothetical protein
MMTVVGQCVKSECGQLHSHGDFQLVHEMHGNWLAIAPDGRPVWLPPSTMIAFRDPKVEEHPLLDLGLVQPSVEVVIANVNEMIQPRVVKTTAALPGCYWSQYQCTRCHRLQFEPTLWLETVEQVRNHPGTLAVLSGLMSSLLVRVLRCSGAICRCS